MGNRRLIVQTRLFIGGETKWVFMFFARELGSVNKSLFPYLIPVRRKKLKCFYLDLKELFFNTYENKLNSLSLIISRLGK